LSKDEHLYVVDENDNVIGWASRGECHKRGLIHRSVYVMSYEEAARRELREELGVNAQLKWVGKFKCFSEIEREISAIYLCRYNGPFKLDAEEISEGKFVSIEEIKRMLKEGEREFAYGSVLALKEFIKCIEGKEF